MTTGPALTHLALHVADVEACAAFYREFCGLTTVHQRTQPDGRPICWLAEPGRERDLVIVLLPGGPGRTITPTDYSHLGFALDSRAAVDAVAAKARSRGLLIWEPREEPYPVGYYCGVRDPDGTAVEFSYGQPLGPGADDLARAAERA
ncbi:MAG: VOC family protein [Alphaproteobacteria bacterium]|nr:VOC family protein [Alphaproteobacteria bacterium]